MHSSWRWISAPRKMMFLVFAALVFPVLAADFVESPMLTKRVEAGKLVPLVQRIPAHPRVLDLGAMGLQPGRHGGDLRLLMGRTKDVRMMVVYGYARLVAYDTEFNLVPDILEDIEIVEDREFVLHLRKGHRWSDGKPFTAENFRYWWEDVATNEALSPFGPPKKMMVDGELPTFEVIDETTVRYAWRKPNPYFLPALAGTRPLYIYAPKHFLKKYHVKYQKPEKLAKRVKSAGVRSWAALHNRKDSPYKNKNPKHPTLQPWRNTVKGPSQRFVFERNAYFHRVDENGKQLPYVDRIIMNVADAKLIPAKTGAGETDLQARHLKFSDYTYLKSSEKRTANEVRLWETTKGSHIALFPNLNAADAQWRRLFRNVNFRRALSLAIDRHEVNQVVYYGLAVEGNNTVHESCPLFRSEYRTSWADFDLTRANRMLDELGLTERDDDGLRKLPDGRSMVLIVETAGEDTEQTDVLELIHDSWLKAGIKVFTKPMQREVFRNRIFAGKTLMSVWGGLENGVPTANISPDSLAPTSQQQLQWPKWGQYFETKGGAGEVIDMPEVKRLMALRNSWVIAPDKAAREAIWREMLEIHAQQVYFFGLIQAVPQPVVVNRTLRNVPERGIYNWEPGAHFGLYRPDTFWFDGGARVADTK
jgi:peptide/nickel transport system substrate-binding protein